MIRHLQDPLSFSLTTLLFRHPVDDGPRERRRQVKKRFSADVTAAHLTVEVEFCWENV